jgi:hypothetical protein
MNALSQITRYLLWAASDNKVFFIFRQLSPESHRLNAPDNGMFQTTRPDPAALDLVIRGMTVEALLIVLYTRQQCQEFVTKLRVQKLGDERASGGSQTKLTDHAQNSGTIFIHSCLFPYMNSSMHYSHLSNKSEIPN